MNEEKRAELKSIIREVVIETLNENKKYPGLWDKLTMGTKIKLSLQAYGSWDDFTDGSWQEWTIGRKSRSKKYGVDVLRIIPKGYTASDFNKYNAYTLMRRDKNPDVISVAHGDMAVGLLGIRI